MTSADSLVKTPSPLYYAVIFTSLRTKGEQGYGHMADRMATLGSQMPGFLGMECVRDSKGLEDHGLLLDSEDTIRRWKIHPEHQVTQETGKKVSYTDYVLRIAMVQRTYGKIST